MPQEYYVAFSIHNSYCFITANRKPETVQKSGDKIIIDGFTFTEGQPRARPQRGAIKLLSNELRTETRRPLTDPAAILTFFTKLGAAGWAVDDAAFIKKHGLKAIEIPAVKETATEATPKPEIKTDFQTETPPGRAPEKTDDNPAQPDIAAYDPHVENKNTDYGRYREPEVKADEKPLYSPVGDPNRGVVPVEGLREENAVGFQRIDGSIAAVQGDITKIEADAIVNAANAELIPGGGVDGAINRAAGPELAKAMAAFGKCQTGYTVVTDAFDLKTTKHIIHAVGPIYKDYEPTQAADLLRSAYENALSQARVLDCETVALPLLSTGVYGYPLDQACAIAVQTAHAFNTQDGQKALGITFVAFDDAAFAVLMGEVAKVTQG